MDELEVSVNGPVRTITLRRPEKRNALTREMLAALAGGLPGDPAATERVAVIRAAGRTFSAGLDLRERLAREGPDDETPIDRALRAIEAYPLPVVAAVQGDAFAGGNTLALHCDIVVTSESARFGMPLAHLGLAPTWLIGRNLVDVAGPALAREILLTGDPVPASRLAAIGAVARVVPDADFPSAVDALVATLSGNAPLSLRAMKAMLRRMAARDDRLPHDDVDALLARTRGSADAREGVAAWLERRPPRFEGR